MPSVTYGTDPGAQFVLDELLLEAGIVLGAPHQLRRTRYDTFDGLLHEAGLRLERRSSPPSTSGEQLVLTADRGVPAHLPLTDTVPVDPPRVLDVSELPAGPMRTRLAAICGLRIPLAQLTVVSVRRTGELPGPAGAPLVRLHLDTEVQIPGAPPASRTVLEVEELPGGEKLARQLRKRLERAGLRPFAGDLLERGMALAGIDPTGFDGLAIPTLERSGPALDGYRTVLRACFEALEANWEGTADHLDIEFLHDLRIAVRRTRSVLGEGRQVLDREQRRHLRAEFAWLGRLTGPARDFDVYFEEWDELTGDLPPASRRALLPVRSELALRREQEHQRVTEALRSERAARLRTEVRAWLARPELDVNGGRRALAPLGKVVAARIAAAQAGVLEDGRAITEESPATDLHELRKDAKRLRYLLDSFGDLGGQKRRRTITRHLKQLQDNLGEHQDTQIQADELREVVTSLASHEPVAPATTAAVEELARMLEARQQAARAEFAERFSAYDGAGPHKALEKLLTRMSR